MTGEQIQNRDNVARYCPPGTISNGQPTQASFLPRRKKKPPENDVSSQWLEYFRASDLDSGIECVRSSLRLKLSRKARIAVLNVGEAKQAFKDKRNGEMGVGGVQTAREQVVLSVTHDPRCGNPAHASIKTLIESQPDQWLPEQDERMAISLASVVRHVAEAKQPVE